MSDALNYLLIAGPEALGHYIAFLKHTGNHLDPKTRNLIYVITKVHSQTERACGGQVFSDISIGG